MRFAFITDELPRPGMAGHGAMNHAILAWLRGSGHQVIVLLVRPRLHRLFQRYETAKVSGIGVRQWGSVVFTTHLQAGFGIFARLALAKLPVGLGTSLHKRLRIKQYSHADAVLGAFVTPQQSSWCAAQIEKLAPDAVLVDTIFRAPVLREPPLAQRRRVIIAHDLFYQRHRALRSAGYHLYPAELSQETEAGLLALADGIVAIQPQEAAEFQRMCPNRRICTAPMPAQPCPRPANIARISDRLVFVGSATLPNLDGLRWLFAEIWPTLRAARPRVTLDLVGDCGGALPVLPAGVNRLGRVPSLAPVLHRSALAISPLRMGSGLKIKILDYARHGLTTVATAESLAGFTADEEAPFIAAGGAAGFAASVLARLSAPNPNSEQQAMDYVTKYYDVDASFAGLAELLGIAPAAAPVNANRQ
jgi:hypothetical protein